MLRGLLQAEAAGIEADALADEGDRTVGFVFAPL